MDDIQITDASYTQKAYKPKTEEQARRWEIVAAYHSGDTAADLLRMLVDQEYYRITNKNTRTEALKRMGAELATLAGMPGVTLMILSILLQIATKLGIDSPDMQGIGRAYETIQADETTDR